MSLLDSASLIVTPNAYKEGKLYSVIPSDGSGDMSVTRATTATRVNSAGLVELVPYNLLTWSQDLSASWALNQATTTTSQADPFGGTKAIKLKYNTSVNYHAITQSVSLTGPNAHSVYAKAGELQFLQIASAQSIEEYANFNLSTGVVGTYGLLTSNVQIENVGNGWYRCSVVFTNGSNGIYFAIANSASMGWLGIDTFAGANATDGLYLYGAQVNAGSLLPYQKTETRLNIPRLDYSNGTCPSLLVEPQRTNVLKYSEQFDNSYWLKDSGVTVNSNVANAPNGTLTADRINFSAAGNALYSVVDLTTTAKLSVYLKGEGANIGKQIYLEIAGTGSLSVTLTNEWNRFIIDANNANAIAIKRLSSGQADSVLAWGMQLEAGSYATSYIPTTSASVTRNADQVFKTGASSLIGQTEGTLFVDLDLKSRVNFNYIAINIDGQVQNYIGIYITNSGIGFECVVGAVLQAFVNLANSSTGRFKIAVAYKANDFAMYINGNLIGTDTSGSVPTCNKLDLTAYNTENAIGINAATLWKTRLTNDELASLTTL